MKASYREAKEKLESDGNARQAMDNFTGEVADGGWGNRW